MNYGSNFWAFAVCNVFTLVTMFPHELSHFITAEILGHNAEIVCLAYIPVYVKVALNPGLSVFHLVLVACAGGIGTSIFLYLLWRVLGRRGTSFFAFFIPMQLSYAALETMYQLGWIANEVTYLCGFVGFIAYLKYESSLSRSLGGQTPCLRNGGCLRGKKC